MITLANLETQVAHLNAEAFADGILRDAEYLPPEGRDEIVRLAREPSKEHAMQIARSLWGGQWRGLLGTPNRRGVIETHFYDRTRSDIPFNRESFGKGKERDPKTLPIYEQVIEIKHLHDPEILLIILGIGISLCIDPIYFYVGDKSYFRIEPLYIILERMRSSSPSPLEPVLTYGLVSPLERAILFVLGKFPLAFGLAPLKLHGDFCNPIVLSFHDVYHLAMSGRDAVWADTARTIIYCALAAFNAETLAKRLLADALDSAAESSPTLGLEKRALLKNILCAAQKVDASQEEIVDFVNRATLLFFRPELSPFEGLEKIDRETRLAILAEASLWLPQHFERIYV